MRWASAGRLTGFVSKQADRWQRAASIPAGGDTLGTNIQEETFSSFQEDGFHRTVNELEKKDAIGERIIGGHLRYRARNFSIGATAAHVEYDAELQRNLQPYNQFEFQRQENTTVGRGLERAVPQPHVVR